MMEFFTSEKITAQVTRIRDICGVFVYLIEGEKKACLLDTGNGFGNLRAYIEGLCKKPYIVLLTHGHIDHASGAGLFDEVFMNHANLEIVKRHTAISFRREFADKDPILKEIAMEDYTPTYTKEYLPLYDGQVFDLGNLHIRGIATPGHTPGMTMFLIEEERLILFGDGCGQKVLLFDDDSSSVQEYLCSLEKIKLVEPQYDRIIRNHTNGESPKVLLDNVIQCAKRIIEHKDARELTEFANVPLYSAKELNDQQFPKDGSEGNILYREDKV